MQNLVYNVRNQLEKKKVSADFCRFSIFYSPIYSPIFIISQNKYDFMVTESDINKNSMNFDLNMKMDMKIH